MFVSDEQTLRHDTRLQRRRGAPSQQEREKLLVLLPDVASKAQPTRWAQPKK